MGLLVNQLAIFADSEVNDPCFGCIWPGTYIFIAISVSVHLQWTSRSYVTKIKLQGSYPSGFI